MGKAMSQETKQRRVILREWAKAIEPLAVKHSDGEKYTGFHGPDYNNGKVHVCTHRNDVSLYVELGFEKDDSIFIYGRDMTPYGSFRDDNEGRAMNKEFGWDLTGKLRDVFDGEGFEVYFGEHPYSVTAGSNVFAFKGVGDANMFENYMKMVDFADIAIDASLKKADREMERPFKYVVFDHPESSSSVAVLPLSSVEQLNDARYIFEARREFHVPEDRIMIYSPGEFEVGGRYARGHQGRILGISDFLGIKDGK